MKHLLLTTIAAVVLVGCGPSVDIWTAANKGNIEAVKQHIAAGTDLDAKMQGGHTPLHTAANSGHKEVVELLIDNGADVNVKNGLLCILRLTVVKRKSSNSLSPKARRWMR